MTQFGKPLLAANNAFFGLLVTGPCFTGRATPYRNANDCQDILQLLTLQPDFVAWMDTNRSAGALTIYANMAALHRRGGRCARLVKPREPKPSIQS